MRWCRGRTAWVWTVAAVVPTLLCVWLDRSGSDFYIGYGDGIALPANLPFPLHTHAQRAAYARLLPVLEVVTPSLVGVSLVLLVGVLWSRAIAAARLAFLPTLVAFFAAMSLLSKAVISSLWMAILPDAPVWLTDVHLEMEPWWRGAYVSGLCLMALGVVALLLRAFRVHVLRTAAPLSGQTE
ncbi:Hypothetical protein AA314_00550 [Archangium gephyra]|uniref:Uncharacterized protein n=1 Tax=Archangium gephyra TaxID=48 RepID=A0AAC8Q100_9BACT|nr:Hypothetical protein AA314_00550 [Archangium gephyra]